MQKSIRKSGYSNRNAFQHETMSDFLPKASPCVKLLLFRVRMAGQGPILTCTELNWVQNGFGERNTASRETNFPVLLNRRLGSWILTTQRDARPTALHHWLSLRRRPGSWIFINHMTGRFWNVGERRHQGLINIQEPWPLRSRIGNFAAGKPGCWNTKREMQSLWVHMLRLHKIHTHTAHHACFKGQHCGILVRIWTGKCFIFVMQNFLLFWFGVNWLIHLNISYWDKTNAFWTHNSKLNLQINKNNWRIVYN